MRKRSVYVAISCLVYDSELEQTVATCLAGASSGSEIRIGISFIGYEHEYNNAMKFLSTYKNVVAKFYPYLENFGVAKGRNRALQIYAGEDYILQVDAHTYFSPGWDESFINALESAENLFKHDKIVISGVPAAYAYEEIYWPQGEKRWSATTFPEKLGYSFWLNRKFVHPGTFPHWSAGEPGKSAGPMLGASDQELLKRCQRSGFAPLVKISAACIFLRGRFAECITLPEEYIFWEEEIIQSIELISKGFSLVYPYINSPIYHLFTDDIDLSFDAGTHILGDRAAAWKQMELADVNINDVTDKMIKNISDYLGDTKNTDKIKRYERYARINLLTAETDGGIPVAYENLGAQKNDTGGGLEPSSGLS